ncbi:hypothetical protein L9F63_011445, partial [Diploptera punctata]
EKLLESTKYEITEAPINYYSVHMNLRIFNVQKHEFGSYFCSSVNALGKAEGGIRLQELHLAPKTTIVPVSAGHDNKSRKKPLPHSKDTKRKRKRPKGERREEEEDASGERRISNYRILARAPNHTDNNSTRNTTALLDPPPQRHRYFCSGKPIQRLSSIVGHRSSPIQAYLVVFNIFFRFKNVFRL